MKKFIFPLIIAALLAIGIGVIRSSSTTSQFLADGSPPNPMVAPTTVTLNDGSPPNPM